MCFVECAEIRTKKLDDSIYQIRSLAARRNDKNVVFALVATARRIGATQPFLRGKVYCYIGEFSAKAVKAGEYWNHSPAFSVSFILSRSGRLTLNNMVVGQRLRSTVNNNLYEATDYLFKQSYFFIKDMVHRHRHHHGADDTFIECSVGSNGYKNTIAYQLAKRLIRRPIKNEPNSYQSALGILAYLKSYQEQACLDLYPKNNLEAIQQSLNAEYTALLNQLSNRKWIGGAILSIYTFVVTKARFWKEGLDLIDGGKYASEQWLSLLFFGIILIITAHLSSILNWSRWSWFQELMKIPSALQARRKFYRRPKTWLVLLLFACLLFIFSAGKGVTLYTILLGVAIILFLSIMIIFVKKVAN